MLNPLFRIREVDWGEASEALVSIRTEVFMKEQLVPAELEWDGLDYSARHLLALDAADNPIGCARVLASGHIGRMAVIVDWRRRGIGNALLHHAISLCKQHGCSKIQLSAQIYAIPFYEKSGFVITSEVYMDAGIPHRDMCLSDVNKQ